MEQSLRTGQIFRVLELQNSGPPYAASFVVPRPPVLPGAAGRAEQRRDLPPRVPEETSLLRKHRKTLAPLPNGVM